MPRFSGDQYVPSVNSVDNVKSSDVIGNKSDGHDGSSVYSKLEILEDHAHSPSNVYPTLAGGVTLTAGAAWVLGAFVEIVPASTITSDFDIHSVDISDMSSNSTFELVLYQGASDVEIGRIRTVRNAVQSATINTNIQTPIVPANARIRGKVASSAGGNTIEVSLRYHTY